MNRLPENPPPHENYFTSAGECAPNVLLRDARKQKHWKQRDLADKVGVSVLTIGRWERGETTPESYARFKLRKLFNKSDQELGFLENRKQLVSRKRESSSQIEGGIASKELGLLTRSIEYSKKTLISRGDCGQPKMVLHLNTIVVDQIQSYTTFHFQLMNGTLQDASLRFEVYLTNTSCDFFLGRSIAFLLTAQQSTKLSMIFDWTPQPHTLYRLYPTLTQPSKWRNTYRPVLLTF